MSSWLLLAGFETSRRAAAAVSGLRDAGHIVNEGYGPRSSEELSIAIGPSPSRIRTSMFIAALIGAVIGFGTQYWSAVFDYPINSGGRPLASWPAFMLVAFELCVLFAALAGFAAFFIEARLTQLHSPLFEFDEIQRASQDRSILEIETNRPAEARQLLERAGAISIEERPI